MLLALAAAPSLCAGPPLSVRAARQADTIVATIVFQWDASEDLVRSLLDGMESRIVFTARLYEQRTGFLGDRLLGQSVVVRRAYRDILSEQFVVAEDGAADRSFETSAALLAGFFTIPRLSFPAPSRAARGIYVAARAELQPVLLMPPLTLVTLVGTAAAYATPWARSAVQ